MSHITIRARGMTAIELLLAISVILVLFVVLYFTMFSNSAYNARLSVTAESLNWLNDSLLDKTYRQRYQESPKSFEDIFKMTGGYTSKENGKEVTKTTQYTQDKMPKEKISSEQGSNACVTVEKVEDLDGSGGWAYISSEKRICVNWTTPLNSKWPIAKFPALKGDYPPDWGKK